MRHAALMLAALACAASARAQTTERIEQTIWLKPQGEAEVEETNTVRFADSTRTRIVREIPIPYPTFALVVTAAVDGRSVELDGDITRTPEVETIARRGYRGVAWTIAPRAGSIHIFSVWYAMWAAVRQDERGDYFSWRVTPMFRDGDIDVVTLAIAFAAPLSAPPEVRAPGAQDLQLDVGDRNLRVVARGVPRNGVVTARLRFARNAAAGSAARWQARTQTRKLRGLAVLAAVMVMLLLSPIAYRVSRRRTRGAPNALP